MIKKKIAFIGTGFIAQICHIPCYAKDRRIQIVAICDQDIHALKLVAKKYKIKNTYNNHEDLLNQHKNLDAIILTVPRHETYRISKIILKNKINLFTEKPMALSKKSALELVRIAKKNKIIYTIGHMKRHDERIKYLKKLFKKKQFNKNALQSVYYESFAGDSYGKLKTLIKKNKKYKSHFLNFDVLKNKVPKNKKIKFLKFLNTHSHAFNLLRYLFGEMELKFKYLDNQSNGIIGLKSSNKIFLLNTRKIFSNDWHENIFINFNNFKIKVNFPMPMKNKQQNTLTITNLKSSITKVIKLKNNWSFENQANSFVNNLYSKKNLTCSGEECIEDLSIIENIFL